MRREAILLALPIVLSAGEAPAQTRLYAGAARSELSFGMRDWSDVSLALAHTRGNETYVARLEDSYRFGQHDLYGEARWEYRASGVGSYYLAVGAANDADFRPELALKAGAAAPIAALDSNWLIDIDRSYFYNSDVWTLRTGFEHTFADRFVFRALAVAVSEADVDAGWVVQGEAQASARLRMRLSLTDAPETSERVVTRVRSWGAGAQWQLNDAVMLRADFAAEDRGVYERNEFSLGAAWRL